MSQFTGPQGKGAMKRRREMKREEAAVRRENGASELWPCGHRSSRADHPCEVIA